MPKITIHIEPTNGLSLPELGHFSCGEHELEVSTEQLAMLKTAEGLSLSEDAATQQTSNVTKLPSATNTNTNTKPEDAELLTKGIREAFIQLDPQDKSLWTNAGKPKTESLEAVLGYNITAVERDAAIPPGYNPD